MSVVALGAVRSCGVTTLAVALAATWPEGRRVLLAELDPAGGTLAAASGWPPEPGLVSLAAAARRDSDPNLAWRHCHALAGGTSVLAGPASADRARSALGMLAGLLGRLDELADDVLIDCGRLAGMPPSEVLLGADRVLLVVRPYLSDLHALATWLEANSSVRQRSQLVLVGQGPYPDAEVAEALNVEVVARLPWDPDTADLLVSVPVTARELKMAPLVRAARTLADALSGESASSDLADCAGAECTEAEHTAEPLRTRVLASRMLSTRVRRPWRTEPATPSTNGAAPETSR